MDPQHWFLLHHCAELVDDEAEDVIDLREVDGVGHACGVWCPNGDVRGGVVLHAQGLEKPLTKNRTSVGFFGLV
jgi:hypothetical protein